ncbi:phosphonate ABC transporter ATP-binding protein [Bdellovibrio sp. qaytius]|nr:phosphonate ABC transporter ATP-binding protein [Bdellovibrio sp. qaytius]
MMSVKPILSIKNLQKTYPNGVQALKGVSFDVKKGEFLVVIGLSGSGKSTMLRCINRLNEPTAGEMVFNDGKVEKDLVKLEKATDIKWLRQNVGMIFQHFNLIPRHSVLSNVLMGKLSKTSTLKSLFGIFSDEDIAEAMKYLKLVGIAEKAHIRADQLSGGQQQRVAIARALTQNPQILLADEPVASLDPATCHVVMDYLRKVNQELGITIICNLHFLSLVRQYATRVVALKGGELVYEGDPKSIDDAWFEKIYGAGAKEVHIN